MKLYLIPTYMKQRRLFRQMFQPLLLNRELSCKQKVQLMSISWQHPVNSYKQWRHSRIYEQKDWVQCWQGSNRWV